MISAKDMTCIVAASAFRAKYAVRDRDGNIMKTDVRVECAGVDKHNRAGVYPAGCAVKRLCHEVLKRGFLKEEVIHVCVAVQEPPAEELVRKPLKYPKLEDYKSSFSFNAEMCELDELLMTCFEQPYNRVDYTFLSHNHMMLVMRAFLTKAKWNLSVDEKLKLQFCDDEGRLDLAAVAEHPNAKEMQQVIQQGIPCEVLSWKMDMEEPEAASIISQALNSPASMAMRTTDLTAIAVLKGEIMFQLGREVSQKVAYKTVLDKVRVQLDNAADDEHLPEIFEFLISNGVASNSFISELLEWAGIFVDGKKRQLRFHAFGVINKMCDSAPWAKMAVIKRAYRKEPQNGFCPSPESAWGDFKSAQMQLLEELLRFFHVSCSEYTSSMQPQSRIKFLANVDIKASEAFFTAAAPKLKSADATIKKAILAATRLSMEQLGLNKIVLDKMLYVDLPGKKEWIVFEDEKEETKGKKTTPEVDILVAPQHIRFDQATGQKLDEQDDFARNKSCGSEKLLETPQKLPFRYWLEEGMGSTMGDEEADVASAVSVLGGLHDQAPQFNMPVDVFKLGNLVYVTSQDKAEPKTVFLPPCVPKQSKVLLKSEHPDRVAITMKFLKDSTGAVASAEDGLGDAIIERVRVLYVNPEFVNPKPSEETPAVAATAQIESDMTKWKWGPTDSSQSMHPFWAVRRLTDQQLRKLNAAAIEEKKPPKRFNCELTSLSMTIVTIGLVGMEAVNCTRTYEVPFMTNTEELQAAEELIMRTEDPKKKAEKRPIGSWKDAYKTQESKMNPKPKKLAKTGTSRGS